MYGDSEAQCTQPKYRGSILDETEVRLPDELITERSAGLRRGGDRAYLEEASHSGNDTESDMNGLLHIPFRSVSSDKGKIDAPWDPMQSC